ncbi:hypothetical protein [Paenibacillus thermotolerans]|uniref:hypothetical protein n=1 Tax=Paenibacillus thermotolerans TaxID=3027807 RepID=UPI0023676C62|nr:MULTISPECIES: hypothetical protein [unclassified Paenibacillus]
MFVSMSSMKFAALEDTALGAVCFDPVIPKIRGKSLAVKEQVYEGLTPGQQALFMFNAYYNHASKSLPEFYWWSAYYLAQPKAWSAIKASLNVFGAETMLHLLDSIEELLDPERFPRSLDRFAAAYNDLDGNPALLAAMEPLYDKFNEASPAALKAIGGYIRNHSEQFIRFEE